MGNRDSVPVCGNGRKKDELPVLDRRQERRASDDAWEGRTTVLAGTLGGLAVSGEAGR